MLPTVGFSSDVFLLAIHLFWIILRAVLLLNAWWFSSMCVKKSSPLAGPDTNGLATKCTKHINYL